MLCAPSGEPCDSIDDIHRRLGMWPLAPGGVVVLLLALGLVVAWFAEKLEARDRKKKGPPQSSP